MASFLANHQFFSLNVLNSLFYSVRAIVLVKVYITDFFYFLDEIYMVLKENPFFFFDIYFSSLCFKPLKIKFHFRWGTMPRNKTAVNQRWCQYKNFFWGLPLFGVCCYNHRQRTLIEPWLFFPQGTPKLLRNRETMKLAFLSWCHSHLSPEIFFSIFLSEHHVDSTKQIKKICRIHVHFNKNQFPCKFCVCQAPSPIHCCNDQQEARLNNWLLLVHLSHCLQIYMTTINSNCHSYY